MSKLGATTTSGCGGEHKVETPGFLRRGGWLLG